MTPADPGRDVGQPLLSIVVPMLDEAAGLPELRAHLAPFERRGCEVLLVDGGSSDESFGIAQRLGFHVIASDRGRARQMNAGAARSHGERLLFLHADTLLPPQADTLVVDALESGRSVWGRFDVRITGTAPALPVIAWAMNHRSRLTGIATGDQAMFMTRAAFERAGGFPDQPLMEDIELSRRLRSLSKPACLTAPVLTSGRRWEVRGVLRTTLLMWRLRFAYWCGTPAQSLAARYR